MVEREVLVIDSDPHAGQALVEQLRGRGFGAWVESPGGSQLSALPPGAAPELVIFNLHHERPEELAACRAARLQAPDTPVVGLATSGPGLRFLREWNREHGCLAAILEKPLRPGQLTESVRELLARQRSERASRQQAERIASLVPVGAEQALRGGFEGGEEMFEAAIVFTDIRRSSELITSQPARTFFHLLNESLSAQGAVVRACQGAVVKYTGDGLMAVFRGMGHAHLAVRCALHLAQAGRQDPMGFGIGVAQGLVLAGLVGDFGASGQRQQYDVIGSTVHLAARLCASAEPGQVIATRDVLRAARLGDPGESLGAQSVRGFPAPVECVALRGAPRTHPDIERIA